MRAVVGLVLVAACGRLGFDGTADDLGAGDAARADAGIAIDAATDAAVPGCDDADPTLVACWAFEGNTLDSTADHNDAANTTGTYVAGHDGLAIQTDETTNLAIASSASLSPQAVTIDAWIQLPALPASGTAYVFVNQDEYALGIQANGTVSADVVSLVGLTVVGTTPVTLDTWHHLALRYDSVIGLELYLDDHLEASTAPGGPVADTADDGCRIGGDGGSGGTDPPLLGVIDDVRVWNVARPVADL